MRLPDGPRSRAILIGASQFSDDSLSELPAVRNNLIDLSAFLTDPDGGALRQADCTVLGDEPDIAVIGDRLESLADQAEDMLLVYYAGHGLVDRSGELYLSVPTTRADRLRWTGLPFTWVRQVLSEARADNRILLLDCCFAGRAINAMTDPQSVISGGVEIAGTYTLTSTAANTPAHAPRGARHTAFTGELIELLWSGDPAAPELLTLGSVYQRLNHVMRSRGLPPPQQHGTNTAVLLGLTRNRAHWGRTRAEDTATTRVSGAEQAVELLRELVADRTRVLGADHPDTLTR